MKVDGVTWKEVSETAKIAIFNVVNYLQDRKETKSVTSVEEDETYQKKDIDLIWKHEKNKATRAIRIEVKGDTRDDTGNIFVEIISNMLKNTPGCFIYTEAVYIYYYFINTGELNIINMKKFHEWWKINEGRFSTGYGKTKSNDGSCVLYTSKGKVVPKKVLIQEIGMVQFILPNFTKKAA